MCVCAAVNRHAALQSRSVWLTAMRTDIGAAQWAHVASQRNSLLEFSY